MAIVNKLANMNKPLRSNTTNLSFLLPALILLNIVMTIPLIYSLGISFTKWVFSMPGSAFQFAGFGNYIDVLKDLSFWKSVRTTIFFTGISLLFEIILGTLFALFLNQQFFGRGFVRSLVIIPMVIPPAVIGLFWKLIYSDQGVLNYFLYSLGMNKINWLDINRAIWSAAGVDVWQWTPFVVIIILAGLQSIDNSVIEAAKVDGASTSKIFFFIELPFLIPYLIVILFFRLTDLLKEFDKVYLLTQGGPGSSTRMLSIYTYETGFRSFEIAKTTSISWLFAILMLIFILPILTIMFRRMKENNY